MNESRKIRLFLTKEHDCSYRAGQKASTLFVDPHVLVDENTYYELNQMGFRRSGQHFYKPHCAECAACIPSRVEVSRFIPNRQQARTLKKNAAIFQSTHEKVEDIEENFALYCRYIELRHCDGDMYPPDRDQFEQFILQGTENTLFVEYRLDGDLLATSVLDRLPDGLSAIYTYFDPTSPKLSLGVYTLLRNIELAGSLQLPYLYMGYWIEDCKKMQYKTDYRPAELLISDQWQPVR